MADPTAAHPPSAEARTPALPPAGPARPLASAVLLLGVLFGVGGLTLVVNQLTQPGASVEVLVDEQLLGLDDVDGLPEGSALRVPDGGGPAASDGHAAVVLEVAELPAGLRALSEAPFVAGGLLALGGAWILSRLLLEVAAGRPFAERNPTRLRALAVVALLAGIVPGLLSSLAAVATLEHVGAGGDDSPLGFTILELSLGPLLLSAALFVAAAVFQHGQRLTDEVEGLV